MCRWKRSRRGLRQWGLRLLGMIDWLLGTHLVEQAAIRWQQELDALQNQISSLEARLEELNAARGALLRHLCLSYLQLRQVQSPEDWFHFDPRDSDEESAIEVLTRALVAPHWARWKITQAAAESTDLFTYDLVPNWTALHQDALKHGASLPPSLLVWLAEHTEQDADSGDKTTSSCEHLVDD